MFHLPSNKSNKTKWMIGSLIAILIAFASFTILFMVSKTVTNNWNNNRPPSSASLTSQPSEREVIEKFLSSLTSKDIAKVGIYLDPSYRKIFLNRYVLAPLKLNVAIDSLRESESAGKTFEANMTINYVFSSLSSTLVTPVTFRLRQDKDNRWRIYEFQPHQAKGSSAPYFNQMASFYEKLKSEPNSKAGLNLFPQYEIRLLENDNILQFDSSKPMLEWLPKLQAWIQRHPLLDDNLVYIEKTGHGYSMLVTSFDDGNLLYLGISDQTGEIVKIFIVHSPIDSV
ncbi:MAG: hypothetical protein QMC95_17380 [Desulfitobacteriaceae bacterium]|nr:hypothetical protein [Desulfitobacteriaceae bacterium]MDI6915956.1 hypothetical protein [Desulfitobacteriaceae bacterium]